MTGAPGWAAYLAASAVIAVIVLAAGGRLGEVPAPAPPATVCVGFWQGDRPCGTPPDDWRPDDSTDSAASP